MGLNWVFIRQSNKICRLKKLYLKVQCYSVEGDILVKKTGGNHTQVWLMEYRGKFKYE